MGRLHPRGIEPSNTDGQILTTISGQAAWAAAPGGSAGVQSVVAGTGISVDDTDPANPIVSATGSGGGGTAPAFLGCLATRTTAQSIPNNTATAIQFNDADAYDTSSIHDPVTNNTRFTVPTAGVWSFTVSLDLAQSNNGYRLVAWSKNGVTIASPLGRFTVNGGPGDATMTVTLEVLLAAGDYIEALVFHTNTGALNLNSASLAAHFIGTP